MKNPKMGDWVIVTGDAINYEGYKHTGIGSVGMVVSDKFKHEGLQMVRVKFLIIVPSKNVEVYVIPNKLLLPDYPALGVFIKDLKLYHTQDRVAINAVIKLMEE